jgi:hypothetical protein
MAWITQVLYGYEGLPDMVALPPAPTVPYGTAISVYVRYRNDGATNLTLQVNLWLQSPDGVWRVISSSPYLMAPGQETMAYFTPAAVLNQVGTWNVVAAVWDASAGAELARWSSVLATVTAPTLSGRFYPPHYYWYPGLAYWALLYPDSPPTVPGGTEFHLALVWLNNGSVSVRGHVDLTVTRPDGSQVVPPAVLNQDNVAAPGSGWAVQFAPITLDQAGSWTARAVLSGEAA